MSKSKEQELFDAVESIDDTVLADIPAGSRHPKMGDLDWSDYVLTFLDPSEFNTHKGNKLPKTEGLYRIIERVLDCQIIKSDPDLLDKSDDGVVTVKHTLELLMNNQPGLVKTFGGLCDVSTSNLDPPFSKYLAANGGTRAKGRALRDALRLKVCVAEELSTVAEEEAEIDKALSPASGVQKAAIKNMCSKLKINVDKFISSGEYKYATLDKVPYGKAQLMHVTLNNWSKTPEGIPASLKDTA